MLILLIACFCFCFWGFNSVVIELAKRRPREPLYSLRHEVDAYIWSDAAPLSIRRRYIMSMACLSLSFLCVAWLVWVNELDPGHKLIGIGLAGLFALVVTASLARKVIKHGL